MVINEEKLDNALKLIEAGIEKKYFPCAAVSIGCREKVINTSFYGNRSLLPEKLPLKRDTLFDLASLTKVVATNTLFMKYMESGIISVYDRVVDYIQEFRGDKKEEITIFNLLTHTAGFAPFMPLYKLCRDYDDEISYICCFNLDYEPGSKVVYSDFSYIILGYILEQIGGDRLDKLCKKNIFDPLGMDQTCFNPISENVAATEIDRETGLPFSGIVHDENARFSSGISGHAGLFSTIDDMTKFCHMLINNGSTGKSNFLSPLSIMAMTRNYTGNLNENRGFGWCIKGYKVSSGGDIISPSSFGHTGFTGTSVWIDMQSNIYIVLLTNRVHPSRENTNIVRFRRLFHNAVLSSLE
jgi:Beta-lactamase class C and other penicillin binding proteins